MRLRPPRNANANAAPPPRPRNRNAMNAAKANAREAWPLGKEGSNSASHPYPARFRKEARTSQGRGRPTANLIASVTTTVMPRRTSRSKAASRRPRHHRGTATSPRRYAAPRVVTTIMNASAIGLEPARFSRWKSISSGPSAGIARGSTRRNRSAHIKPAADPETLMARAAMGTWMDPMRAVYQRLLEAYGPQAWWPAETPFEVIVGALLMQQTAWRNVEAAIRNLKAAGLFDPSAIAAAPIPILRKHVRVAGLYGTKPARLKAFCRHLLERAHGDLGRYFDRPTEVVRADLLAQDGVGPETADSILLYAGGHPVFVVDAYTVRIGTRIGLFRTREYRAIQNFFEQHVPRELATYQEYHALLVRHAKTLCRRTNPVCEECPIRSLCDFGRRRKR